MTANTKGSVARSSKTKVRNFRKRSIVFAGQKGGFVGMMLFNLSLEDWVGFRCLGMENSTPGRMHRMSAAKVRRCRLRKGPLGLRWNAGEKDMRFGIRLEKKENV